MLSPSGLLHKKFASLKPLCGRYTSCRQRDAFATAQSTTLLKVIGWKFKKGT